MLKLRRARWQGIGAGWMLALLIALSGTNANAVPVCVNDTLAQTYACSITFTDIPGNFTTGVGLVPVAHLPQFDPSMGTLDRIEHQLTAQVRGDFTITNVNSQPSDFDLFASANVSMLLDALLLAQVIPQYDGDVTGVPPDPVPPTFISVTSPYASATGNIYDRPFSPTIYSAYVGSGMVPFIVTGTSSTSVVGDGDFDVVKRGYTNLTATVLYHYSVPEPATLALIGSSLLVLGFVVRRRNRTA